jgi:hypothetical protein
MKALTRQTFRMRSCAFMRPSLSRFRESSRGYLASRGPERLAERTWLQPSAPGPVER